MAINVDTLAQICNLIPRDLLPAAEGKGGEVVVSTERDLPGELQENIKRMVYVANGRANFPVRFEVRAGARPSEHRLTP